MLDIVNKREDEVRPPHQHLTIGDPGQKQRKQTHDYRYTFFGRIH